MDLDTFSLRLSLPLLEQIFSRRVTGGLLSERGRWEQRERKLSQ
jgi:hypothetical protein